VIPKNVHPLDFVYILYLSIKSWVLNCLLKSSMPLFILFVCLFCYLENVLTTLYCDCKFKFFSLLNFALYTLRLCSLLDAYNFWTFQVVKNNYEIFLKTLVLPFVLNSFFSSSSYIWLILHCISFDFYPTSYLFPFNVFFPPK
jgi:hypothetical protein